MACVYVCFPVFHTGNNQFLFSRCKLCLFYTAAKIRACEHLQKFCEHEQASTHLIFASNSSKGQIFRALSNWIGPFHIPLSETRILDLNPRRRAFYQSLHIRSPPPPGFGHLPLEAVSRSVVPCQVSILT